MINFSGWKAIAFMVGGLIVFGLYLYFFVGIDELFYSLRSINTLSYVFFFSLAVVSMILALFCWTASWRTILRHLRVELGVKKAFMIFMVGYFLDLVIPSETIGSELTRLYLVRNETQGDLGAIAASAVTNRIVEYSIVAIGLSGSVVALSLTSNVPMYVSGFLTLVLTGVLIYLTILLLLALKERAAETLVSIGFRLLRFLRLKRYNSTTAEKTKASLMIFYRGFQTFRRNPKKLGKPLIFQLLSFLFNIAVYGLVFEALGVQNLSLGFLVLTFFISSSIQGATASLSVGSLDIILLTVFTLYGIEPAVSGIAVIVLRSVTYWIPLLTSYIMVEAYGFRNVLSSRFKETSKAVQQKGGNT